MAKIKISWVSNKIKLAPSKIYGHGLFAKEKLKKRDILIVFGGFVMDIKELKSLPKDLYESSYQISDKLYYSLTDNKHATIGEYINHSCNPNAGFKGHIILVAMRDINKGEEVTMDYATYMTTLLRLKCLCGEDCCRKLITGNDWKIHELQRKYKGYFQPYIEEKIERYKK